MKILISAFSCGPGMGSEPGLGWGIIESVAKQHDVWVLTNETSRPLVEERLHHSALPNCTFVYLRVPVLHKFVRGLSWAHDFYYVLWQVMAAFRARQMQKDIQFDVVHHATYASAMRISWLGWVGAPFVWGSGPVETTPLRMLSCLSPKAIVSELIRNVAVSTLGRLTRAITGCMASIILTPSPPFNDRTIQFPIGALDEKDLVALKDLPPPDPSRMRIISIGRLLGWKGFALGIKAFAEAQKKYPDMEYWIVGEGPERSYLETLAASVGCRDRITFTGKQTRADTFRLLGEADILLHPSFHEQFGYVVVEAMAAGRPVICFDVGGPATLVASDCGVKLSADQDVRTTIQQISVTLLRFAREPEILVEASATAQKWVTENWTWAHVGSRLTEIYEKASERNTQSHRPRH